MFTRLAHFILSARRSILVGSVVGLVLAAVFAGGVFDRLLDAGFEDPTSESTRARELLESEFGTGTADVVFLVTATDVDDPAVAAAGTAFTSELAGRADLDDVASYWSLGSVSPLRSVAGDRALVIARIPGDPDTGPEWDETLADMQDLAGRRGPLTVELTGRSQIFDEVNSTIEGDLARAEAIAVPITLALLIAIFGGVVAALLPLTVGIMAVVGAFLVLFVLTGFTDVSVFSINLVTGMGLALGIDYSLFIVSRFREELAAGHDVDAAVVRTVETAGRTIAFSAVTVAISISALLIFPLYFLRSFAYAGIGVLVIAMVASTVTLPALLAVLGHRVDAWTLWTRKPVEEGRGFWHRTATAVMGRPVTVAVVAITLLLVLGLPFLRVVWGVPDHRVLPEGSPSRDAVEIIMAEFDSNEAIAFPVVVTGELTDDRLDSFAADVSALPEVDRVDASTGRYFEGELLVPPDEGLTTQTDGRIAWFNVVPNTEPISIAGEDLVREIRGLDGGFEQVFVGGESASLIDTKAAIFDRIPIAAAIIALSTFVLLFLMFGSLLVPIKAIVLNLLSLTATFGAMVWVFQDGNGAGAMDFTPTGLTDVTTPILMFCIAFGLSMDYEVFLLSRIKEEYDRTGDNDASVASGLERTGRIVTAAALVLAVTFIAFASSRITFIKLFGLGLATAVLVDATIVRATLVPALMKIAGSANWWAPAWMHRIHDRFGISEVPDEPSPAPAAPDSGRDDRLVVHRAEATGDPQPDGDSGQDQPGDADGDLEPDRRLSDEPEHLGTDR